MRIGHARPSSALVRQSPLVHGRFSFQDEAAGSSPARPTKRPLSSGNAGRSASRYQPNRMHPGWDEALRAIPERSRKNASEQPLYGPSVVGDAPDGRLHSGVRTHPCAWTTHLLRAITGDGGRADQPGPIRAKKMSVGPSLAWGAARVKTAAKPRPRGSPASPWYSPT
jgi:hypothetical protein